MSLKIMNNSFTSKDDIEMAYDATLKMINRDVIGYTVNLVQSGIEINDLRSFMQGFLTSTFIRTLNLAHIKNDNPPMDPEPELKPYITKLCNNENLEKILKEFL